MSDRYTDLRYSIPQAWNDKREAVGGDFFNEDHSLVCKFWIIPDHTGEP